MTTIADHDLDSCPESDLLRIKIERRPGEDSTGMMVELHMHGLDELDSCIDGLTAALTRLRGYKMRHLIQHAGFPADVTEEMLSVLDEVLEEDGAEVEDLEPA